MTEHPAHTGTRGVEPHREGAVLYKIHQARRTLSLLSRVRARRACRETGGHWWHPIPGAMIDWFCCQCPAETDGMPKDGSSW